MAARGNQMSGASCCSCAGPLFPTQSSLPPINTSGARVCSSCTLCRECRCHCAIGKPEASPTDSTGSNAATTRTPAASPIPPSVKGIRDSDEATSLYGAPYSCPIACANKATNGNTTAPAGRLLLLPDALLLRIFRFFSVDELPQIAAASPRLWRMLLRGELLQKESATRLHSGRRWVSGNPVGADGIDNSGSRCCSLVPWLLTVHPRRIRCLSLSSRVLEPVPSMSLLLALRGQSSSLEELLICSGDFCSQGITTGSEAAVIADGSPLDEFPVQTAGSSPASPQQRKGAAVSCSETEELGMTPPYPKETLEKALFLMEGIVFRNLQRLRLQGCQMFLWLRILSHCNFPKCKELIIAANCIREHTVPPPHGASAAAIYIMDLMKRMPELQLLNLELAVPPARCFWRELLLPQQHQQQPFKIQRLLISEAVFLNLAEVIEKAKMGGIDTSVFQQQCALTDICVVASQRRLHPATLLHNFGVVGSSDTSSSSYSISSEYVEIDTTSANNQTGLQLLPQAVYFKLILGVDNKSLETHSSSGDAANQGSYDDQGTEAAAAGPGEEQGLSGRERSAGPLRALRAEAQRQHEATLAPAAADAPAAAAALTAAQLCRMATAARSISLDFRSCKAVFRQPQETVRDPVSERCPYSFIKPERNTLNETQHGDPRSITVPSIRVVGLPSRVTRCLLPLDDQPDDIDTTPSNTRCRFCGCLSCLTNNKAAEASKGCCDGRREMSNSNINNNNNKEDKDFCVCFLLQMRVLPLLHCFSSFLLGHSGGGTSPWGFDTTTGLIQSDWMLLRQVCCNSSLRSRCIGLDVEVGGQTPQQRRSFHRFLRSAATVPESQRPPLRLLRLSLVSDPGGPSCVSGFARLNNRAKEMLIMVMQHYPLLQRVEVTAPHFLHDPAEEPSAAKKPLPLLLLQQFLKDQGFEPCSCDSRSALRHVFIFSKTDSR